MKDKYDDISIYGSLEQAANFYLGEAFHYINRAMEGHFAGILFGEKIKQIDPTKEDRKYASELSLPTDTVGFLREMGDSNPLTQETIGKMGQAWAQAQYEAHFGSHEFKRNLFVLTLRYLVI